MKIFFNIQIYIFLCWFTFCFSLLSRFVVFFSGGIKQRRQRSIQESEAAANVVRCRGEREGKKNEEGSERFTLNWLSFKCLWFVFFINFAVAFHPLFDRFSGWKMCTGRDRPKQKRRHEEEKTLASLENISVRNFCVFVWLSFLWLNFLHFFSEVSWFFLGKQQKILLRQLFAASCMAFFAFPFLQWLLDFRHSCLSVVNPTNESLSKISCSETFHPEEEKKSASPN